MSYEGHQWHNKLLGDQAIHAHRQIVALEATGTVEDQEEICFLQRKIQDLMADMFISWTIH